MISNFTLIIRQTRVGTLTMSQHDCRKIGARPRSGFLWAVCNSGSVRYLDKRGHGAISEQERDKMLFWFMQAGMWGVSLLVPPNPTSIRTWRFWKTWKKHTTGLTNLIKQLRLWHGGLRVEPEHFEGWSLGHGFIRFSTCLRVWVNVVTGERAAS